VRVACACACAWRGPSYLAGIDVGYTAPCCRLALRAATATALRGRHASSCSGAARRVGGGDSDSGRATPCRAVPVPVPVRADLDRCWWWWSACLRSRTGRGAGALQHRTTTTAALFGHLKRTAQRTIRPSQRQGRPSARPGDGNGEWQSKAKRREASEVPAAARSLLVVLLESRRRIR
jgi:hypothetical protein